jgi:hypothetical protein
MLTDTQYKTVWERQIDAEVRSLYFADLTHRYAQQKQAMTFLTFFLSSGAAVTLIAKFPPWVAIMLSALVALMTAYSVALRIDAKISTMSKLHGDWATLAVEYENLRENPNGVNTDAVLNDLLRRDLEASKIASTEAPNDQKRIARWTDQVFSYHGLPNG